MNITLRKANAVQNSINDTVKGIKIDFTVELNEFQNVEDAITKANDIQYGLSSYVWSENLGRAHRVAAAIEAGMCFVNSQNVRDLRQPFGGTKASGTGREGGTWSYEVFLEPKNVCVSLGSHPIPHWGVQK